MPSSVNRLGLRVAAVTFVVVAVVFGAYWGIARLWRGVSTDQLASRNQAAPTPLPDTDGDGLPDKYEDMYSTNAAVADTDGDGVTDLNEIDQGTDPAIAAPNDVSKPPTGSQVAGLQTYTQQYLATLPEDAAREDILDQTRLEAFVATHRGPLLPELAADAVRTTTDSGKEAVQVYLETISAAHNDQLAEVTNEQIEAALTAQLQQQPGEMQALARSLERNIELLRQVPAPTEVVALHRKLLAATQALYTNVIRLRDLDQDFVGGIIATKNIDDLGGVFQEIADEVAALEQQYGLE